MDVGGAGGVYVAVAAVVSVDRAAMAGVGADDDDYDRGWFLFVSVSGYLAGMVGSSNNPVSGITISTILFASAVLVLLLGRNGLVPIGSGGAPLGAVAAIMIGAVVCCAAAVGGDNLQDLKAGYLVGATPWKQQVMMGIGTFSCALIMAPVLNLLAHAYGIGPATPQHPNALSSQATLMASVARGLFGGQLPWTMIGAGVLIGAFIIGIDEWLKVRGARFRVPVLAAAIGIYLPLELMVPIFLGACCHMVWSVLTRCVAVMRLSVTVCIVPACCFLRV